MLLTKKSFDKHLISKTFFKRGIDLIWNFHTKLLFDIESNN